jgi:hypothetical protein
MTELRDGCEVAQIPKINLIGHGYQSQRKSKWTTADIYSNNRPASSGALLTNWPIGNAQPVSFFATPPTIETTVFTRLPKEFRKPRRTAWSDANRQGREVDSFLEGPSFDRNGDLYVTDIPYGRVFRISPQGRVDADRGIRRLAEWTQDSS